MTSSDDGTRGSVSSNGSDGGSSCRTFRSTVIVLLLRGLRLLLLFGLRLLLALSRRWGCTRSCRLRLG